jgi:hypothetical protein
VHERVLQGKFRRQGRSLMTAPTAAKGAFPYPHRTVAQVDADERWAGLVDRAKRRVRLGLPLSRDMRHALEAA